MNTAQLIAFLKNALSESQSYDPNDDNRPSMQYHMDGSMLAAQIRSLLKLLEAENAH